MKIDLLFGFGLSELGIGRNQLFPLKGFKQKKELK